MKGLFLSIEKPTLLFILGHNGTGKSTFFRVLTKQLPFTGSVSIHGKSLIEFPANVCPSPISILQQELQLNFEMKVCDFAVMGLFRKKKFLETYSASDYEKAYHVFEELNISGLFNEKLNKLSGGERQMVRIAQALLQETEILLLDEPTRDLDILNKSKIFTLIEKLVTEKGKTILCITHDIYYLMKMQGSFINFSAPIPTQEFLTKENLETTIKYLEQEKSMPSF